MPTLNSVTYNGDDTCGPAIYNIKETLVAEGWTVRGSGDGLSRFGDADGPTSVPVAQRGSGGEFDCWTSGSTAFTGVAGGAGNTDAWCWLRSPSGDRDVILTSTLDGFTDSDGRIGYTRKGAGGFVGGSTNPTTFPAVPAGGAGDEFWGVGSRTTDGNMGRNVGATVTRYDTCYADGEFWWRVFYDDNGTGTPDTNRFSSSWAGIFPLVEDTVHPSDPDPVVYGRLRINVSTPFGWWQHSTAAFVTPFVGDTGEISSFGSSFDGERVLYPLVLENSGSGVKGTIDPTFLLTCGADETQGERVTLPDGRVHMVVDVSNRLHFRVPDGTATIPNVTASDLTGYNAVPEGAPPVASNDFTITAFDPLTTPGATIVSTATTLSFNIARADAASVDTSLITITLDGSTIWDGSTFSAPFTGSSFSAGGGGSQDLSLVRSSSWPTGTRFELVISLS